MNAILIARVSTEEQREAGNSLPAQVMRLERYCQREGFNILKICSFRLRLSGPSGSANFDGYS